MAGYKNLSFFKPKSLVSTDEILSKCHAELNKYHLITVEDASVYKPMVLLVFLMSKHPTMESLSVELNSYCKKDSELMKVVNYLADELTKLNNPSFDSLKNEIMPLVYANYKEYFVSKNIGFNLELMFNSDRDFNKKYGQRVQLEALRQTFCNDSCKNQKHIDRSEKAQNLLKYFYTDTSSIKTVISGELEVFLREYFNSIDQSQVQLQQDYKLQIWFSLVFLPKLKIYSAIKKAADKFNEINPTNNHKLTRFFKKITPTIEPLEEIGISMEPSCPTFLMERIDFCTLHGIHALLLVFSMYSSNMDYEKDIFDFDPCYFCAKSEFIEKIGHLLHVH